MNATTAARWRVLCLILIGAFLGLSVVVYGIGLLPGDAALHEEVLEGRGTPAHAVARWLDYGGKWVVLGPAMAALLVASPMARRRWWLWCGLIPLAGAFEQLFKFLVARPRPRGVHWGFPSGHVTAATAFAVILIYILSREGVSQARRAWLAGLVTILVVSVAFARLILNAHWPSDVLGGALLGAACAAAGAWWDAAHPPGERSQRSRAVDDPVRIGG